MDQRPSADRPPNVEPDGAGPPPAAGSERSPADTRGYRSRKGHPHSAAARPPGEDQSQRRSRSDAPPPGGWLPPRQAMIEEGGELLSEGRLSDALGGDFGPRPGSHQIGLRLRWDRWRKLQEAAEICGCPPTTLAKILVARGAAAIVEEWQRDQVGHAAGGPR